MNKRWRLIEKLRNSNETYEKNFMERLGARQRREQAIYEKIYTDMCKQIDVMDSKNWTEDFLSWVHTSSSCSENRIREKAKLCGCFYCGAIFPPDEIEEWADDGYGTPICPHCGIDSVIDDASGFPITKEFLRVMEERFFGGVDWNEKENNIPWNYGVSICKPMREWGDLEGFDENIRKELQRLKPIHNNAYYMEFAYRHPYNIRFIQVKRYEGKEGCYIVMMSHYLPLTEREKFRWKKVSKLYRLKADKDIDAEKVLKIFKDIVFEIGNFDINQWFDVTMECIEKEVATDEDLQKFFA